MNKYRMENRVWMNRAMDKWCTVKRAMDNSAMVNGEPLMDKR